MRTLRIQIEVDEGIAQAYQNASKELKKQLSQNLRLWLDQHLQIDHHSEKKDSWESFLENIDELAIDTGVSDLSLQHDHYLYGVPKQ